MLVADIVRTQQELIQILQLQRQNLKKYISKDEMSEQGFVTLEHTLDMLQQMHELAPSIIIKDGEKVVAYALTELKECRHVVPDLESMFALLDTLSWNGNLLSTYSYYVMGQVCIAKDYRGQGLFEKLFRHHKEVYQSRFDLFVTEISTSNHRSLRAHEKIGFKIIHIHRDVLDEWAVVVLSFKG